MTILKKNGINIALVILTVATIIIVAIDGLIQGELKAKELSETLGGAGTAIALLWIIGGYFQQRAELALQREELRLQRLAHQQQADESQRAYKLSLKQELARMLKDACNNLTSGGGKLTDLSQMATVVMPSSDWKIANESLNPTEVMQASSNYLKDAGRVAIFLHTFAAAAEMYFDANSIAYTKNADPAEFIYIHSCWLTDTYPFREYIGSVSIAVEILVLVQPAIKALTFAFLAAGIGMTSVKMVKLDVAMPDYLYLKERDCLPALGKKYAYLFENLIAQKA